MPTLTLRILTHIKLSSHQNLSIVQQELTRIFLWLLLFHRWARISFYTIIEGAHTYGFCCGGTLQLVSENIVICEFLSQILPVYCSNRLQIDVICQTEISYRMSECQQIGFQLLDKGHCVLHAQVNLLSQVKLRQQLCKQNMRQVWFVHWSTC